MDGQSKFSALENQWSHSPYLNVCISGEPDEASGSIRGPAN